jgi:hypothetical protein
MRLSKGFVAFGVGRAIALGLLFVIAIAYSVWATVQAHNTRTELTRITRLVEGTPGPQGKPGLGVESVLVHTLPPGSEAKSSLRHGLLQLWLPIGETGARGPRGPGGTDGHAPSANQIAAAVSRYCARHNACRGPAGEVSERQIRVAVETFMRSHTFVCQFKAGVLTCRVR